MLTSGMLLDNWIEIGGEVLCIKNILLLENSVDPDQLASGEAIRSGSTLFSTLKIHAYNRNAAGY